MALPAAGPDRTCVVTGASSGIGAEIARELARRGLGVTLVARRAALLEELASSLDVRTLVLAADLTSPDERAALPGLIAEQGLIPDVLINNAGFSTTGPIQSSDHEREVAMVRTNVEAVVDLCSLFVPDMASRGVGAVLNVASTAAFQPIPGQAAYAASKAFVLSYTQAIRTELRGTGVTATALCPGPVKTEFVETAGFESDPEASLPKIMWVPAPDVARAAVNGLASGKAVVIPGIANRVGAGFAYLTPRSLLLPILARQHPAMRP